MPRKPAITTTGDDKLRMQLEAGIRALEELPDAEEVPDTNDLDADADADGEHDTTTANTTTGPVKPAPRKRAGRPAKKKRTSAGRPEMPEYQRKPNYEPTEKPRGKPRKPEHERKPAYASTGRPRGRPRKGKAVEGLVKADKGEKA